jgi:HSP20 family protein
MLSLFSTLPTLDRVFDDVMRDTFGSFTSVSAFSPSVDIRTDDDRMMFYLDVPGVRSDDLSVEIEGRYLRVRGERKFEADEKGHTIYGRSYGSFDWSWTLPDGMDTENLKTFLDSGVLTIEVPKHPKAKPRRVQILTSGQHPSKQLGDGSVQNVESSSEKKNG